MTVEELREKVRLWDLGSDGESLATARFSELLRELEFHADNDWRTYLPAENPQAHSRYMDRLAAWVGNVVDEKDQQLLLEYAYFVNFLSHEDYLALYRVAFAGLVTSWVAGELGRNSAEALLDLGLQELNRCLQKEVHKHTWFCPVTDSMDINEFYKINHIVGVPHRPSFWTLHVLAEGLSREDSNVAANIRAFMSVPQSSSGDDLPTLKRLVLLEDFVGCAEQCIAAVRWAVESLGRPTLFIPLLLCPSGATELRDLEREFGGLLTVRPVIELQRSDLLGPGRGEDSGWRISDAVEKLARKLENRVETTAVFGFKDTGCSLVTFANAPDNTLPMIHRKSTAGPWEPLFPRISRG